MRGEDQARALGVDPAVLVKISWDERSEPPRAPSEEEITEAVATIKAIDQTIERGIVRLSWGVQG